MTVIAWDGSTLAADKRATSVGYPNTTTKIRRLKDGTLIGASGDADAAREIMHWYENGASPSLFPGNRGDNGHPRASILIITPDRKIRMIQCTAFLIDFEDLFFAIGSGRDYALAAMHLGYGARKAVEVASALDVDCGNGIDALEL